MIKEYTRNRLQTRVSIVICTRNRSADLEATLCALERVIVPPSWCAELIIVDNDSSDNTAQVVRNHKLKSLIVTYVRETRLGLDYARNRGLAASGGEIVLLTDDDVRPPVTWIEEMCAPIVRGEADAVQGGISVPTNLLRPWQNTFLGTWIAKTTQLGRRKMLPDEHMVGANMAFSRHVLRYVPGFDVELDAGALGFGGDTLFSRQLSEAGFRRIGIWDIAVEHHFDSRRLSEEALVENGRARGRSWAYLEYHWEHRRFRFVRAKLLVLRIKSCCRELLQKHFGRDTQRPALWRICYARDIAFYEQYILESHRKPNYDRHGLVKRSGILDPVIHYSGHRA